MDVREVTTDDAAAVAELLGELGYPSTPAQVEKRLQIWSDEPYSRVLLAVDGGRTVGSISVHAIPNLERDGRWLRIESLVVAAGSRAAGSGARRTPSTSSFDGSRAIAVTPADVSGDQLRRVAKRASAKLVQRCHMSRVGSRSQLSWMPSMNA
jgi:hypothetical protein